ncbi:hypothetical protein EWM64_g7034 [Hericium alpestre]|uniref:DUF7770 domain-containing protein n=1 Tax=Hericium alpestre TaxID=135208 RepID=A0A4Y9ZSE7_9AGAM|nr:hypothetical protein EWM64_g7034 [Hericium alpestre]
MNSLAHLVEPPLRPDELRDARLFDHQTLKAVVLWSTSSLSTRHWRTGLEFTKTLTVGSNSNPNATPAPDVVSQVLPPGIYGGISVDMFQPEAHQNHLPSTDGEVNLYGTLSVNPRMAHILYSRSKNLFSCPLELKVSVRVKDVLDLMLAQRRQYYKFNPRGSGCLYWQLQLLQAFVANGWIAKASLDAAITQITALAARPGSAVPYPPVMGTFY